MQNNLDKNLKIFYTVSKEFFLAYFFMRRKKEMKALFICLGLGVLAAIGTVCIYAGFRLNELCNDLVKTEPWWGKLGNESMDL